MNYRQAAGAPMTGGRTHTAQDPTGTTARRRTGYTAVAGAGRRTTGSAGTSSAPGGSRILRSPGSWSAGRTKTTDVGAATGCATQTSTGVARAAAETDYTTTCTTGRIRAFGDLQLACCGFGTACRARACSPATQEARPIPAAATELATMGLAMDLVHAERWVGRNRGRGKT